MRHPQCRRLLCELPPGARLHALVLVPTGPQSLNWPSAESISSRSTTVLPDQTRFHEARPETCPRAFIQTLPGRSAALCLFESKGSSWRVLRPDYSDTAAKGPSGERPKRRFCLSRGSAPELAARCSFCSLPGSELADHCAAMQRRCPE